MTEELEIRPPHHQEADVSVPEGFVLMLQEFTVTVLRYKPPDVVAFAVDYFNRLKREDKTSPRPPLSHRIISPQAAAKAKQQQAALESRESVKKLILREPGQQSNEDDNLTEKYIDEVENLTHQAGRRRSVTAESFDPEQELDEAEDPNGAAENQSRKASEHEKTDEQFEMLLNVCNGIMLFRELEPEQMQLIVGAMFEKPVELDEIVIQQGDNGDNFYVIESGVYNAYHEDAETGKQSVYRTYENKGSFGELALMFNAPRACSVRAQSEGRVWGLSRRSFRKLVLTHAAKRRQAFVELLGSIPILSTLDSYEKTNLADALVRRVYEPEQTIIRQGDHGEELYFVISGNAKVTTKDEASGEEKEVGRIGPNQYFGELALISKKPRSATVTAIDPLSVAVLDVDSFERLLGPCIELMKRTADEYMQKDYLDNLTGSRVSI